MTRAAVLALLVLFAAACDRKPPKNPPVSPEVIASRQRSSESRMRSILMHVRMYTKAHNGALPDSLNQLREFDEPDRDGVSHFDEMFVNPLNGERPGYVYVKPAKTLAEVKDPFRTPILWEAKGGQVDPNGARGFADWQVERK